MSSATLSSSPGPSTGPPNSKRAHSDNREFEDRITKKSRTTPELPGSAKRDAKDKKKRHKRKKRKVSVVVIEDGHARIKDSRRGITQSLVPASPVKAGQSSRSRSESVVLPNNKSAERDVGEIVSTMDKGKGKAVDCPPPNESNPSSAEEQIARLTKELASKNELIEKHQNAVTLTQQAITCQVCLELMYKPYALSPCGHLACYECLVSWFKASPEDRPAPPSVLLRKKTCPHCRAAITDRPVQVWGVKSIVNNFSKSGLLQGTFLPADESGPNANENADPWDGIFRKIGQFGHGFDVGMLDDGIGVGFLDDEDGGVYRCYDCMHEIWDGICSSCGRVYHNIDEEDEDFDLGHELGSDDEDDFDDDGPPWIEQLHEAHALDPNMPPDALARLVEIEAEQAANEGREPDLERFFPAEDDEEYEGSFIDDEDDIGIPRLAASRSGAAEIIELSSGSDDDEVFPVRRSRPASNRQASGRTSPIEVSDSDDHDEIREIRRPTRNRTSSSRRGQAGARPIVILTDSDEDEDDENSPRSSRSRTARRREPSRPTRNPISVVTTDEDNNSDDGIDPNLADLVAAQEREMYGEDDSVPRHRRHRDDVHTDEEDPISDDGDEDEHGSWVEHDEDSQERPDSYFSW